jgi:hypothetical protein
MKRFNIILVSVIVLVLILIPIFIGIFGNHYVCKDNKCEYNYFTLNGLSANECSSTCKKSSEQDFKSEENSSVQNKKPRYYFAKVNVNDKHNLLCLPTSLDNLGRHIIPFTKELATSYNSYETNEECENQKNFGNLYSVNDMHLLNSYYPRWRDYIYNNYNCGPQGCYYFDRPWYWGPRRRRRPIRRRRRKKKGKSKSFKVSKK